MAEDAAGSWEHDLIETGRLMESLACSEVYDRHVFKTNLCVARVDLAATKCCQQFGSCWIRSGKHEHMEPKHESEHHTSKTAIFPGFCDFFWRERF